MKDHYEEIQRLVRPDYGHRCLQELIAELVIKTAHLNGGDKAKRCEKILLMLLGTPKAEMRHERGKDDTEHLYDVARLCRGRYIEGLEPMAINDAITEAGKEFCVPGYRIGAPDNPKITRDQQNNVDTFRVRISGKINEDNIDEHIANWRPFLDREWELIEEMPEDVEFTKGLISEWLDLYARSPISGKK